MAALDPAGEFLRIAEHYRRLTDEELLVLARLPSQLTELAQQALASEIHHRRLELPAEEPPDLPEPEPLPDSPDADDRYADDRRLVELCKVWSLRDALQVQWFLGRAGIPFYMGAENATGVDAVTSNFEKGVSVKIMQIGLPWAILALQEYAPADEPVQKDESAGLAIHCPKCDSSDVIFERLVPMREAQQDAVKFNWTCDSCGHRWEDEGAVSE